MVRLKEIMAATKPVILRFQFHYGSIKGVLDGTVSLMQSLFQFHYGSIKGKIFLPYPRHDTGFNSTMVRLKGVKI